MRREEIQAPGTLTDLLFEAAGVGLCLVAPDGTVLRANAMWLRSTGYSAGQVIGEKIVDLFPETRDMALALHARARAGHRVEVPRHARTVRGRETRWDGSIAPVQMEGGTGLLITVAEVTDASAPDALHGEPADAALDARTAALLRQLANHAPVGVFVKHADGRYLFANRHLGQLLGLAPEDLIGRTAAELFPAAVAERARENDQRVVAGQEIVTEETVPTSRGDRELITVRFPFPLPGGTAICGIAVDLTDRNQALREAHVRAAELQAVLDSVPVAVFITHDRDARVVQANRVSAELLRVDPATNVSKTAGDSAELLSFRAMRGGREIAPEDLPVQRAARGEEVHGYEFDVALEDGEVRHLFGNAIPLRSSGGELAGAVGAFLDITERKRAEQAAAEREAELRLAQGIAHVGSWSWTVGTAKLEASEEVFRIYGRRPGDPIPGNDSDELRRHYTEEGWQSRAAAFRKALGDGQPWDREERILRPDGSVRWVHFRGEAQRDHQGRIVKLRGTVQDITDRKRVEDALRDSEQRFRALTDAMPQIVCALATDGRPEYVNSSWIAYSGLDAEGTVRAGWEGVLHPDDVAAARACLRRTRELAAPQDVEVRYRAADGTYRWFLSRLAPILEGDRVVRFIGAGMDIDDRRRAEAERELLLARVQGADRRKDEFLAVLSHELRNPLAPIRNSIYVLRHVDAGGEQARRARDIIERQTEHLTRLVDDLLDVTRIARGKIELRRARVDLRELVRRAADDYLETMRERGIAFRTELPDQPTWADADATRIAQVVGNLLHNAAKFTRRGGEVALALRIVQSDVEIAVRDTGAGIEPSLLPLVFDAFVQSDRTLARTEGGLGLGLALVKGITELHGGTVRVESAGSGRGAEFVVRLPLVAPDVAGRGRDRAPTRRAGRSRRVLVVDDNRDAAESLAQIVEMLGHAPEVVHDGPTAVERARALRPDVILCDIGLPGMSGYEVAREIRAERAANVQLIAVTGYAQPDDVAKAMEAGFDGHLAKPCDPEVIARLLG